MKKIILFFVLFGVISARGQKQDSCIYDNFSADWVVTESKSETHQNRLEINCPSKSFGFQPNAVLHINNGITTNPNKEQAKEWLKNTDSEYFCVMLLTAYEMYEQECHADSTYKISGDWKVKAVNDTINYLAPSLAVWSERKTWTHKEPTFQGFIGFLRRYKEENDSH